MVRLRLSAEKSLKVSYPPSFRREEEIGKVMDRPGVMKVFSDDDRNPVYMVMEWVEGRLLAVGGQWW